MNILHLKYAVEVDRTRSMTQAAANLYTGQPNLSRAIKDLEESLGITIFKRTSKGIVPTQQGEEFLVYARSILEQIDEIESMYRHEKKGRQELNISIPRASYITHAFTRLVNKLDLTREIEINYKETNSLRAINNILQSNYNLGILRYQSKFESYFEAMLKEKGLQSELIWEFQHLALMSVEHPLAKKADITFEMLSDYIEIAHGDPYVPSLPLSEVKKSEFSKYIDKRIFVYERGSQFDLLCDVPLTYMWVSPIPIDLINRFSLVQRRCKEADRIYRDVLIFRQNYKLTPLETQFMQELQQVKAEITAVKYE
jgi:DNA-binding transcriptional LysR family regulator